jgi:hypothetical protein
MGRGWWRSGYSTKKANERGKSLSLDPPVMPFKPSEFPRIILLRTRVNRGQETKARAVTQTFSAALEDTSPHDPAYDQRCCVIAVGMETAQCCEVSPRAGGYGIRL